MNIIRQCVPISQKTYPITKRLKTPAEKVENYFPVFLAFIDSTEQHQIPRSADKERRKIFNSSGKKKRHTRVKTQLMVNNLYRLTSHS